MHRLNFGECSGAIVNECLGHGTWLDSGDLPRLVCFVLGGGLAETDRREATREREEGQRRRLAEWWRKWYERYHTDW
jgi:hypothetical protein